MATVYKVEIVSHWTNYTKEEMQKILETIKEVERIKGNEIQIRVIERN